MSAADVLISVPGAQLHKVQNNVQSLLVQGDFTVSIVGAGAGAASGSSVDPRQLRVEAAVSSKQGHVAFPLGKHLPALKAAATIYSFALENTRDVYHCLILPSDTPGEVLDAMHDVLHDCCAFSTAKQVDAAYEEADKLNGSKEAAALQAEDIAGARPAAAAVGPGVAVGVPATAPAATAAPPPAQSGIAVGQYTLPSSGNQTADKVASGLLWGGTVVASAVGQAAVATAGAIQSYAQKQIAKQPPNHKPATISPTFKRGLALAAVVASSAAYVTGRLAALVGQASYATALAIARSLPGHKKQQKGELVTQEERSVLHTVGAAGLVAFVDVYDSLEKAAKVVLAQSGDATVQYIEYKYGPEAGEAAKGSVPVAQDMLSATLNFSRLGARAFISKTAKKGAKMYLKSTVAGLPLHEQHAGARVPSFGRAIEQQQQQQQKPGAAAAAPGMAYPAVAAAPAPALPDAARVASSSNILAQPYPAGTFAAAAAAGGAAQQGLPASRH